MPTEERIAKVERVLSTRQPDLRVVLEGVTLPHNASAIIRTCDAAGVSSIDLVSPNPELLHLNGVVTTGADKWLDIGVYGSLSEIIPRLKAAGMTVAATGMSPDALPYTSYDFTRPTAILLGNESDGLTPEAFAMADSIIRIPMLGMVQSLNLSVSAAIILYEAMRQRSEAGFFRERRLSSEEYERLRNKWLRLTPPE